MKCQTLQAKHIGIQERPLAAWNLGVEREWGKNDKRSCWYS